MVQPKLIEILKSRDKSKNSDWSKVSIENFSLISSHSKKEKVRAVKVPIDAERTSDGEHSNTRMPRINNGGTSRHFTEL